MAGSCLLLSTRLDAWADAPRTCGPLCPFANRGTELERGARMVDAMITNTMLPEIGRELLTRLAEGQAVTKVEIAVKDGAFQYSFA